MNFLPAVFKVAVVDRTVRPMWWVDGLGRGGSYLMHKRKFNLLILSSI